MRALGLSFLLLVLGPQARAAAPDSLQALEADPSPSAGKKLGALYQATTSRDQRFWLVQALGSRLKNRADESALRTLLAAAADADPNVRGPALRALAGFPSLPRGIVRKSWLARLEAAASKGAKDRSPAVRNGAADLRRALNEWNRLAEAPRGEASPAAPARPDRSPGALLALWLGWSWILGVPLLVLAWVRLGRTPRGGKSAVHSGQAPAAVGPYSQAIRAGGWLFLSGQIALDPANGKMEGEDVAEQTRRIMGNLKAVLAAAGLDFRHVVKTTVYLRDMASFPDMNAVYAESFPAPAPARATVAVSGLPKGALVEIDAVARFE